MTVYVDPAAGGGGGGGSGETLAQPSVLVFPGETTYTGPSGLAANTPHIWAPDFFHKGGANAGSCFWEMWLKDGGSANATYYISDGLGGIHTALIGAYVSGGRVKLGGNFAQNLGANATAFVGSDHASYAVGEWVHVAFSYDHNAAAPGIWKCWLNGFLVAHGVAVATGPRSTNVNWVSVSCGDLYVGGSTHNLAVWSCAGIRGWEGSNPMFGLWQAFTPDRYFGTFFNGNLADQAGPCSIAYDLTKGRGEVISDDSPGLCGKKHDGLITNQGNRPGPKPYWAVDTGSPIRLDGTFPTPAERTYTPTTPPALAVVFDSFQRPNSTEAFQQLPGLGDVELGLVGQKTYAFTTSQGSVNGRPMNFGILNGKAVYGGDARYAQATVNAGIADGLFVVGVDRDNNTALANNRCGLVFRYVDNLNFHYVIGQDDQVDGLMVGRVVAGVETVQVSGLVGNPASTYKAFGVICSGNNIQVVTASGLPSTSPTYNVIHSYSQAALNTATKLGIYHYGVTAITRASFARFRELLART